MKLNPRYLLVLAAGTIVGQAHADDYINTVLNSGAVAYWRMNAAGENDLVNGYSTTYNGSATVTAAGGGVPLGVDPNNRAGLFDGGGYVSTGMTSQQTFGSGATIMAWINLSELASVAGRDMYIAGKSQVGNDLDIQVETDDRLRFYTDAGGHTTYATQLQTNQWYQVAAEFDNATHTRSIYINGSLVATDTGIATHNGDNNGFSIGDSLVFSGRQFDGDIDEVSVWDRALTADEIKTIYDSAPNTTPEPCTMAFFGITGACAVMKKRKMRGNSA